MSKHVGLLTKVDNTGSKWYRRVLNVGDTRISAGCLVEAAYDSHSSNPLVLTANAGLSSDWNHGRLLSGAAAAHGYASPVGRILGVAIGNIDQRGATAGDERYYDGWVQYRGAAQVSTRCTVTANTLVVVASSNGTQTGHGCVMMTAAVGQGASAVGFPLSTSNYPDADGWTWVYLWL